MTDSEPEWANQLNYDTHTKIYDSPVVTGNNMASEGIWYLHMNRILFTWVNGANRVLATCISLSVICCL